MADPRVDAVLLVAETAEQAGQPAKAIAALEDEVITLRADLADSQRSLRNMLAARGRSRGWPPPTSYGPFVALRSFARWLAALDDLPARQFTSIGDVSRKAREVLVFVDRVAGDPDEMAEDIVEANERLGDALVRIGMALGLPKPRPGGTWGSPEILARIAETETLDELGGEQP